MADGKGCRCGAYSFMECSCIEVDWTPQEVHDNVKLEAQLSEQFTEHERVVQLLFKTKLQLDEANLNYEACLADVKRYKKMLAEAKNLLKIVSESAIPIILKGDDARILKEIRRFLK